MSNVFVRIFSSIIKILIISFIIVVIGTSCFYFYARCNLYNIPVLMYHHISPPDERKLVNVSPDTFSKQMQFIKNHNYRVITPYEYLDYVKGNKKIKEKNLVLITFDDGYQDNFTYAYPLLKENDFPAMIFVVVNKIGKKGYLKISQINEMIKNDIYFGSHTLSEKYLPSLDVKEMKREIIQSKIKLERITDKPVHFFAYCTGGFNRNAQNILKDSGYLAAFTTNRGFNRDRRNNDDIFALRRIKITDRDNPFKLWVKLSGIYHIFHNVKEPF